MPATIVTSCLSQSNQSQFDPRGGWHKGGGIGGLIPGGLEDVLLEEASAAQEEKDEGITISTCLGLTNDSVGQSRTCCVYCPVEVVAYK